MLDVSGGMLVSEALSVRDSASPVNNVRRVQTCNNIGVDLDAAIERSTVIGMLAQRQKL
jgi:hypothetical protein